MVYCFKILMGDRVKYRFKIDTPFGSKGEMVSTAPSGNYYFGGIYYDPKQYPDLFEPIEEEKPKRFGMGMILYDNGSVSDVSGPYSSLSNAMDYLYRENLGGTVVWPVRFDNEGFIIMPEDAS